MGNECFQGPPLTPGARRAMARAAVWSGCRDSGELTAPAVLLGLLGESECRAAAMLGRAGIDADAAQRQWPELGDAPPATLAASPDESGPLPWRLAPDMEASLHLAMLWLAQHGQPVELATEHLLLGLAAGEHATGDWLRSRGLARENLETELRQLYGDAFAAMARECIEPPEDMLPDPPWTDQAESDSERIAAGSAAGLIGALRILDAAANRASEGLRVAEDYVRFVLDDRHLTGRLKQLRHALVAALAPIPLAWRLAARETLADVGTEVNTESEWRRESCEDVATAAFVRFQESLRSLEEYGKFVACTNQAARPGWPCLPTDWKPVPQEASPSSGLQTDFAARLEQIRYESYTLHRAIEITRSSLARLGEARLYVLIDGLGSNDDFNILARDLILAGVDVLQLRDKRLSDRELLERARLLRRLTQGSGTLFVMNDRPDLAVLARADGVHVGQEELSIKDLRTLVGPQMLLGASVHSIDEARQAVLAGANYLGVGPVYSSRTKSFSAYPGPELLRTVAAEIRLPAFAVGGIDRGRLPEVLETGIRRIAVGAAVTGVSDPPAAVAELRAALLTST